MRITAILILALALVLAGCGNGDETEVPTEPPFVLTTVPTETAMVADGAVVQDPTEIPPETSTPLSDLEMTAQAGAAMIDAQTFEAELDEVLTPATPIPPLATATLADENALPIPLPGTLVASETEDPEPPGLFDYISMEQEGGRGGSVILIEIYGDGTVIANGITGQIGPAEILEIDNAINTVNFFGMQGALLGPPGRADGYIYRLAITRNQTTRAINAQEGYMPGEFINLLGLVRQAGNRAGS